MFFSRKKIEEKSSLIILFESGVVRAGVVLIRQGETPRLIYETSHAYTVPTKDSALRLSRMQKALAQTCQRVADEALPHIVSKKKGLSHGAFDAVRFVYCAPWYISKGRRVVVEYDTPTLFSASVLQEIMKEQEQSIIPKESGDVRIIEHFATGFSVDGYRIDDVAGKTGKRLSLNMFASALPTNIKNAVEETFSRSFHARTTTHHSLALTACQTIATRSGGTEPFLFVHISDTTTEFALFSHDALLDTATMPVGADALHDAWSSQSKRPAHEARFRLSSETQEQTIFHAPWQSGYSETLGAMLANQPTPLRIHVLSESSVRASCVAMIKTTHTEMFRQNPTIEAFSTASFGSVCAQKQADMNKSPALCLAALHESLEA